MWGENLDAPAVADILAELKAIRVSTAIHRRWCWDATKYWAFDGRLIDKSVDLNEARTLYGNCAARSTNWSRLAFWRGTCRRLAKARALQTLDAALQRRVP